MTQPTTNLAPNPNFPRRYGDADEAKDDAAFFTKRYSRQVIVVRNAHGIWLDFAD